MNKKLADRFALRVRLLEDEIAQTKDAAKKSRLQANLDDAKKKKEEYLK